MPRIVGTKLKSIACTHNGFGGTVQISGNSFGSAFQNLDLTGLRDTRTIFPFPAGPMAIALGETKSITMDDVRFSLKITNEPPELSPKSSRSWANSIMGWAAMPFLFAGTILCHLLPRPPRFQNIRRSSSWTTRRPI
jgi:hypothetical protein